MNEKIKPSNTTDAATEQDNGLCASAPGSADTKIKQLWDLLEELAALGVTIGISGGLKRGYSMRIKPPKQIPPTIS